MPDIKFQHNKFSQCKHIVKNAYINAVILNSVLRNEFNFRNVHGIMNIEKLTQSPLASR